MAEVESYDLLVVGGGKGGKTLAMDLARAGRSVAMIERSPKMIGGTCINVACIPTKTLIRSAEVADLVRRSRAFGIAATVGELEADELRRRKEAVVTAMRKMNHDQFIASGMDLVIGDARFVSPRRVEVTTDDGSRLLEGRDVVIDLGTRPAIPLIEGLPEAGPLTSESLLDLERIPEHLLVLGGSYVGVKFAQAMQRFGSRVTVIERGPHLLPREDEDIAAAVTEILIEDGVEVVTGAKVTRVSRASDDRVRVEVGATSYESDDLLVALGRTPNTENAGLDAAGVEVDESGFISVDDRLRTSAEHTFVVGDANGGPQFTHVSLDDYRIVKSALDGGARTTTDRPIPYTVFLDPELGRIGLTEREARANGHDVRIAKIAAAAIPRAKTLGATRGLMKAVVDRGSDRILGAAILAVHGGEVMAVVQTAMMGGLTATDLRDAVLAHPTMAEGLNQLFAW